jgi:hypothetical protein
MVFEKVGIGDGQVIAFLAGLIAGSTTDATCHVEQEALLDDGHRGVLQIASAPSLVLRNATVSPKATSSGDLQRPLQEIECMGAQLDDALQVCLGHEGVGALGGGEGPTSMCGMLLFGFNTRVSAQRPVGSVI